jgi:hypothetical protein
LRQELQFTSSLVWTLGRGIHGKSFWIRFVVDELRNAGHPVTVVDGDRNNPSLSNYFQDVIQPVSAADPDVEDCVRSVTEEMMENPQSPRIAVMDFGANDLTLKRISRKLGGFDAYLARGGIRGILVHFLGTDPDDLALLRDMEDGVFAPAATVLILNEALLPPYGSTRLFEPIMQSPIFRAAVNRGALPIFMPRLEPEAARLVNHHRRNFIAAATRQRGPDGTCIGPWYSDLIMAWRLTMLENHRPVMEWLR